jgi:TonB family protein
MARKGYACVLFALTTTCLWGVDATPLIRQIHQEPDQDGVYYSGPQVAVPKMLRTVLALYPYGVPARDTQGMTVLATVIDVKGMPTHLQVLHSHGDAFDQAAIAAVKHSAFEPGKLGGKAVPVWIDVRVVFRSDRSDAIPQVLIAERDLPPPNESQFEDKHHNPLSYTPPFPIHTVDADFADPFAKHPWVQVAIVTVQVSDEGKPTEAYVRRGLGFGLDEKAAAAVMHYRFFPATQKGRPIAASRDVMVSFAKF